MAATASRNLVQHINRSAGQHIRAIRGPDRELLDLIYCISMESASAAKRMPYLCAKLGIDYAQLKQHQIKGYTS